MENLQIWIGMGFAALFLLYAGWKTRGRGSFFFGDDDPHGGDNGGSDGGDGGDGGGD